MVKFLAVVFDVQVRRVVAALWFVGASLATIAAVLSAVRPNAGPWWAFVIPAVLLLLLGFALLASKVWAMAVSFVGLAGQIAGVAGTTLELAVGIDARKAAELRALGFDPTLGVSINLAFSLAAVAVLAAALLRARASPVISRTPL
jgi:hypothetical protein